MQPVDVLGDDRGNLSQPYKLGNGQMTGIRLGLRHRFMCVELSPPVLAPGFL